MPKARSKFWRIAAGFLAAAVLFFLVFEGLSRLYFMMVPEGIPSGCMDVRPSDGQKYLRPNCSYVGNRPYSMGIETAINSCGFRGPQSECSLFRDGPGQGTIIVIGDSYTEAAAIPFEESYPKVLERCLRSGGMNETVLNFGVADYDTGNEAQLLKEVVLDAGKRPDMVILQFELNDFYFKYQLGGGGRIKPFLRANLASYRLLSKAKNSIFKSKSDQYEQIRDDFLRTYARADVMADYNRSICGFGRTLDSNGIRKVLLFPLSLELADSWDSYTAGIPALEGRLISAAQACGWSTVYTLDAEKTIPYESAVAYMKLDHHPSTLANGAIGSELCRKILAAN